MIPVIPRGQKNTFKTYERCDLESKLIIYNNNPIDKWCMTNTAIDIDKNDNQQPIKTSKSRRRIDVPPYYAYVVLQDKKAGLPEHDLTGEVIS